MIWSYSDDPSTWHVANAKTIRFNKKTGQLEKKSGRRHTILGKWHQIKKEMYEEYLQSHSSDDTSSDLPF